LSKGRLSGRSATKLKVDRLEIKVHYSELEKQWIARENRGIYSCPPY